MPISFASSEFASRVLPPLVAALVGLLGLAAFWLDAFPLFGLAGAGAGVVAYLWTRPVRLAMALVVAAATLDWLSEELAWLPHGATFAIEGLIALLVARAAATVGPRFRLPSAFRWLCVVVALGVLSAVINQRSPSDLIIGLRPLLKYPAVALALVNLGLTDDEWTRLLRVAFVVMFAQVPLAFYEWLALGARDDQVFGSLRSTGILAVLIVVVVVMLVARFLTTRRWHYLLATVPFFPLPVLGEAKAFYLLAPVGLMLVVRRVILRRPLQTLSALLVLGALLYAGLSAFSAVEGNARLIDVFERPRAILESALLETRAVRDLSELDLTVSASTRPRLDAVQDAWRAVQVSQVSLAMGFGPGSRTFTHEQVQTMSSRILYVAPVATRLYEMGLVGLALYWVVLASAGLATRRRWFPENSFGRSLALAMPAVLMVYLVADVYTDTLNDAAALAFWLLAAAGMSVHRRPSRLSGQRSADTMQGGSKMSEA